MQFANAMREEGQTTFTENGAVGCDTFLRLRYKRKCRKDSF